MEGPVADHVTATESQVEHRREREIDAAGTQFRGHYMAGQFRPAAGVRRIVRPAGADRTHRRNGGEAGAESLHTPPFMVDTDR